jgi:dienelactone hydrolase
MVMRSTDGSYFSAHFAHPDLPSATGVVILPDVRGLHDFYRELAHRFAEAGQHAVAIDYFGRTRALPPEPTTSPSPITLRRWSWAMSTVTWPPLSPGCARRRRTP